MAEFRPDLRGEHVVVSPGRSARPYDFHADAAQRRDRCPFCPGRESRTPPEVHAVRRNGDLPDTPGWTVRVVPNRYPFVPPEPVAPGEAFGIHEVIIETPDHDRGLADLDESEIDAVLSVYQQRLAAARRDPRIAYASIFKNHGAEAGASLEHSHAQLMATPFVPKRIEGELKAAASGEYLRRVEEELRHGERIVRAGERLLTLAPADSRFPYELWMLPRTREAAFEETDAATRRELAAELARRLATVRTLRNDPAYHLLVYTAPFQADGRERYWWRIELFPRLSRVAGFEWATGVFVNQVSPEAAARTYRG